MPFAVEAWLDWFTDVTDSTSTGLLADVAWTMSRMSLSVGGEDPVADGEAIIQVLDEFWEAFQNRDDPEKRAEYAAKD